MITRGRLAAVVALALTSACVSTSTPPPAPVQARPLEPSLDRKAAWILRLEQQRVLTDPAAGADLLKLMTDASAGIRRRTALALGRIGAPEAAPALTAALADSEEAVRVTAAFALGLIGDARNAGPLLAALNDPSAAVRGRAAEALGLINATTSAGSIATAAQPCPALIAAIPSDDETTKSPEIEACRLSILALVRLKNYDALARVVLDPQGRPVSPWWPVAFALQRSGEARAADALAGIATWSSAGVYAKAFAVRGLASLKDPRVTAIALDLAARPDTDLKLRATAIRALGQLPDPRAVTPLLQLVRARTTPPSLVLEALTTLGAIADPSNFDAMLNLFSAPSPYVRSAAMAAAARMDIEGFLLAMSTTERDREWLVRANLASVLATLPIDKGGPALAELAGDPDVRVQGPALRALATINAPDLDARLTQALASPDFAVRSAAAEVMAQRHTPNGPALLIAAFEKAEADATPDARLAILDALAAFPAGTAGDITPTLTRALSDREWPVRIKAASILRARGDATAAPARPAPLRQPPEFFESDKLLRPAYSPQAYIETAAGTIQIQLDVIDAPLTTLAFIEQAKSGVFNGLKVHRLIPNFVIQAGDPRGDGEGGPGYTIRDELNMRPFVRGSVGMALSGPETAGSQFFITLSPQPHLDARYTLFGHVVKGMDLLDKVALGDVITKITIDDGSSLGGASSGHRSEVNRLR